MQRADIFCEIQFLKEFFSKIPVGFTFDDEQIKLDKLWRSFAEFIIKSNIHINIPISKFRDEYDEEIIRQLWKRSVSGQCGLEFHDGDFVNNHGLSQSYKDESFLRNGIFFVAGKNDKIDLISQKHGILIFNQINWTFANMYFEEDKTAVQKGEKHYTPFWRKLKYLKHPCNSFSIIDNYILQDEWKIKKNLIPLLDLILPDSMDIDFHISIFALKEPNNKIVNFQSRIVLLEQELKKIRPDLNYTLSLFSLQDKSDHDRSCITNYIMVDSGSGFDVQGPADKTTHKTTITASFPIMADYFTDRSDKPYENIVLTMKKIYDNAVHNERIQTFWGVKKNRLFEN